jgi:uncharacterized protein (TIGR03083 family)
MFDALYRDSRSRVAELARSLTDEQLATRIAACPEWTARQLVAHLVGVAADIVNGNTASGSQSAWTAAQVRARSDRSLDELFKEWDEVGPVVETGLADRSVSPVAVFDVITHEADLRETLGLDRPPASDVDAVVQAAGAGVLERFDGPGTLVIRAGEHEWTGGKGEPHTVVTVEPYELLRGLFSRRSRRQMLAWRWEGDGDPDAVIENLPVFGPRDDDQPVPPPPP